MTTLTEAELKTEHALEELKERFPGEKIEIITLFDIAHIGWECDSQGALILRDGVPELVIVDQVGGDERSVREILEAEAVEYERLASETRGVLGQLMVLEGLTAERIRTIDLSRRPALLSELIAQQIVKTDPSDDH